MKKIIEVDCEPTWIDIFKGVKNGNIKPDVLKRVCKTMDIIRQAQKQGKKGLIIKFGGKDKPISIEEVD